MVKLHFTQLPELLTSVWMKVENTKRRINVNGWSCGQVYIFRVGDIGTDPTRTWSEPVIRMVI